VLDRPSAGLGWTTVQHAWPECADCGPRGARLCENSRKSGFVGRERRKEPRSESSSLQMAGFRRIMGRLPFSLLELGVFTQPRAQASRFALSLACHGPPIRWLGLDHSPANLADVRGLWSARSKGKQVCTQSGLSWTSQSLARAGPQSSTPGRSTWTVVHAERGQRAHG
jgi:hypothetical protein